ncbi:hypothetical protein BB561_002590 [Smittium simulii]|uniref:Uncharacterized protein n=1 Tax=Smittium simulii TaxID=133385 RepID=A0A2T9YQ02_9FUNG|nr:hypothetical protein BB561_002590 [Smittium simulii]
MKLETTIIENQEAILDSKSLLVSKPLNEDKSNNEVLFKNTETPKITNESSLKALEVISNAVENVSVHFSPIPVNKEDEIKTNENKAVSCNLQKPNIDSEQSKSISISDTHLIHNEISISAKPKNEIEDKSSVILEPLFEQLNQPSLEAQQKFNVSQPKEKPLDIDSEEIKNILEEFEYLIEKSQQVFSGIRFRF